MKKGTKREERYVVEGEEEDLEKKKIGEMNRSVNEVKRKLKVTEKHIRSNKWKRNR